MKPAGTTHLSSSLNLSVDDLKRRGRHATISHVAHVPCHILFRLSHSLITNSAGWSNYPWSCRKSQGTFGVPRTGLVLLSCVLWLFPWLSAVAKRFLTSTAHCSPQVSDMDDLEWILLHSSVDKLEANIPVVREQQDIALPGRAMLWVFLTRGSLAQLNMMASDP